MAETSSLERFLGKSLVGVFSDIIDMAAAAL
jgi:hypothetical protein